MRDRTAIDTKRPSITSVLILNIRVPLSWTRYKKEGEGDPPFITMAHTKKCECRLRPHLPVLQTLAAPHYSSKLKTEVLKHCSNDCILKICEIVYNLLKGVIPLTAAQKRQLGRKKHILRRLVQPQPVKKRRGILIHQKGLGSFVCGKICKKS